MEYYDSINNNTLYTYYFKKNGEMLQNESVIAVLDKLNSNDGNNTCLDLFNNDSPYKTVKEQFENEYDFNNRKFSMISNKTTSFANFSKRSFLFNNLINNNETLEEKVN